MDVSYGPISALCTWTRTGRKRKWPVRPVTDSDVGCPGAEAVSLNCDRSILAACNYVRRDTLNLRRGVVDRRVEDRHPRGRGNRRGRVLSQNRAGHCPVPWRRSVRRVDNVEFADIRRIALARRHNVGGNPRTRRTGRHLSRGRRIVFHEPADTEDPVGAESTRLAVVRNPKPARHDQVRESKATAAPPDVDRAAAVAGVAAAVVSYQLPAG